MVRNLEPVSLCGACSSSLRATVDCSAHQERSSELIPCSRVGAQADITQPEKPHVIADGLPPRHTSYMLHLPLYNGIAASGAKIGAWSPDGTARIEALPAAHRGARATAPAVVWCKQ